MSFNNKNIQIKSSKDCTLLQFSLCSLKSIKASHLVFWVMLGVTRIRKYFPPSAGEFYRKRSSIN